MRVESQKPARGDGGGWIHQVGQSMPVAFTPRENLGHQKPSINWDRRGSELFRADGAYRVRRDLAGRLGVAARALARLAVGLGHDRRGEFSSWPERSANGRIVGIVRRYANGQKMHMPGGTHGLYLAHDWLRGVGPILCPEGGSDTAALLTMGLAAIGRPSNTSGAGVLAEVLRASGSRQVVVLGENDRKLSRIGTIAQCPAHCPGCSWCWPGRYGAEAVAKRLTAAIGQRVHWRLVEGTKDVREWLLLNGPDGCKFMESLRHSEGATTEVQQ